MQRYEPKATTKRINHTTYVRKFGSTNNLALDRTKWKSFTKALCSTQE
jgi:hypothetical protein